MAPAAKSGDRVLASALDELVGPVIVLDARLAIRHATPAAETMVGTPLPRGVSIVKALCGQSERRPIAEALARGAPVTGSVVRPAPDGTTRTLRVSASPIRRGDACVGWIVALAEAARAGGAAPPAVLFHGMWTRDPAMKRVFHIIERAARRDVGVLVRGPTGSGKELVAHAIHALSARAAGPFRAVNCAALPPTLLESELFGHVKGAFTGAVREAGGIFRAAHRGTLFLDEVAEMPLDLQAKLLRVIETRTIIPVGGTEPVAVDARIVAATHQSLRAAVAQGRFRADLMYRLRVVPIFLPALAARRGDIALLVDHVIAELNAQGGRQIARVSPAAREALDGYAWPGNVRELQNALEYAYVIGDGAVLMDTDLPPEISGADDVAVPVPVPAPPASSDAEPAEARRIRIALERAAGSREQAARMLGISRVTLWRRMKAYGLAADAADDGA